MPKVNEMRRIVMLLFMCGLIAAVQAQTETPIDPFDYNFCGGERVYPIVGVNFSTSCGPRNQVALGRRGKLMWFFPGTADGAQSYKGQYKLSKEQLARLSTMAEVAKMTDNPEPQPYRILYKMGINFSARQPKYIYAAYSDEYTPSNELMKLMLSMVPITEQPNLPNCGVTLSLFDPTLNIQQRKDVAQQTDRYEVAKQP